MKKYIIASFLVASTFASANPEFQGTMVLKGSVKSKLRINGVDTTCRVSVEKVRNILDEDAFGNPGYTVRIKTSLSGRDEKRKVEIKHDQTANLTNFHKIENKIVAKDLLYADEVTGSTMEINYEGRLEKVKINYQGQQITCLF